jgi:hypothetical protein
MLTEFYFGPVIECAKTMQECFSKVKKCPKCQDVRHDEFCSKCGSLLEIVSDKVEQYNVNFLDYCEDGENDDFDDLYRLCFVSPLVDPPRERVDLFIGDVGNNGVGNFTYNGYYCIRSEYTINLSKLERINMIEEICAFCEVYNSEIKLLKKIYGDDKVSVDFKLLTLVS